MSLTAPAHAALLAGDLPRALAALLDAWRTTPATELADLIAAVGARAQRAIAPPSGRTARDRDAAWHALARQTDAVTAGILIDHLGDSTQAETIRRMDLLAKRPADPRFAAKLGDFLERPLFNASLPRTREFWLRLFTLLPDLGDPRLLVRAHTFPAIWAAATDLTRAEREVLPRRFARVLPALEAAYAPGPPPLSPADAAACAAMTSLLRDTDAAATGAVAIAQDAWLEGRNSAARAILAEAASEPALLAAVYANPDDDRPRRAYADLLVARSDPRGEFIHLQLAATDARRARSLLATHQTTWLGPLATMVKTKSVVFARGFLDACELRGTWEQTLADDERWSTVRTLELSNAGLIQLAALTRPLVIETLIWQLRQAHSVDYGHAAAVAAFRRLALPRLRHVEIRGVHFVGPFDRAAIETAPVSAQLATLAFHVR